jgi:hypothetical protein
MRCEANHAPFDIPLCFFRTFAGKGLIVVEDRKLKVRVVIRATFCDEDVSWVENELSEYVRKPHQPLGRLGIGVFLIS